MKHLMLISLLALHLLPASAIDLEEYRRKREFCEACSLGDVEKVRGFLAEGLNPEFTLREYQKTPLVLAVELGKREIVRLLMVPGVLLAESKSVALETAAAGITDIDTTALQLLPPDGKVDIAETLRMIDLLIELGANVNANDSAALVVAAGTDIHVFDKLLLAGGTPTNACLVRAVRAGKSDVFEALLNAGLDPKWTDEDGRSLLQHAVVSENKALLERLAALGLAINGREQNGRTAIFEALAWTAMNSLEWLIKHGADLNAADKDGVTPLMFQAGMKQGLGKGLLEALIEEGARVADRDARHRQALDYAADASIWENVAVLLNHGAVPSDSNGLLNTMVKQSFRGAVDQKILIPLVTQMLPHLSGLSEMRVEGWPLMSWAVFVNSEPLAVLLQKSGADLNATDDKGCTPLMCAARVGYDSMMIWLEKAGADPARMDHAGLTAADWAKRCAIMPEAGDRGNADTSEIKRPDPPAGDLFAAIAENREDDVKRILLNDPRAVTRMRAGMQPVHLAAALGRRELLKLLIEHGASAQAPAADSLMPVTIAAQFNQVKTAVELGRSLNANARQAQIDQLKTVWKNTPYSRNFYALKVLLLLGWQAQGSEALFAVEDAVLENDRALLEDLLSQGISLAPVLKGPDDPFIRGESHENVLKLAAQHEDTVMLSLLLKRLPVKDTRWSENISEALHSARSTGNLPAVAMLVEWRKKAGL